MKFEIKKVGNYFVFHDITEKRTYGKINIQTGKFVGNTHCLVVLTEHNDKFKQSLIDDVLEEIKKDVASGDLTAIEELLRFTPYKNLMGYLP